MSSSNCWFLTCIQISQESGQVIWYSHLSEFSTVYCDPHSQKLWLSQKAEIDGFLELSWFFDDPADVGNLISGSSAFSKTSLNIRKFTVHILLKPGLKNFKHYFTSMWEFHYLQWVLKVIPKDIKGYLHMSISYRYNSLSFSPSVYIYIRLWPTCAGSWKKQESSRKTSISALWLCQSLWLCGSQ